MIVLGHVLVEGKRTNVVAGRLTACSALLEKDKTCARRQSEAGSAEDEVGRRNHRGSSSEATEKHAKTKGSWCAADDWRSTKELVGDGFVHWAEVTGGVRAVAINRARRWKEEEGWWREQDPGHVFSKILGEMAALVAGQKGSLRATVKKQKEANTQIWEVNEDTEKARSRFERSLKKTLRCD